MNEKEKQELLLKIVADQTPTVAKELKKLFERLENEIYYLRRSEIYK